MPQEIQFNSLLRLLDDKNEVVQKGVSKALLDYHGDASDDLAALGIHLKPKAARLLSESLHPGRQRELRNQWVLPTRGLNQPDGDWETFESLLRLISDFLHDGITLRPSLSDELDLLARDALPEVATTLHLSAWLFGTGKFRGNKSSPFDPRNSDLTWCLEEGTSNPLGLGIIFMLVGQRLGLEVFGVNYPGHFLCLIDSPEGPLLIDSFHRGRPIPARKLLKDHPELSQRAISAVKQPCNLSTILLRLLANLHLSFQKENRLEDADLIGDLIKTFDQKDEQSS